MTSHLKCAAFEIPFIEGEAFGLDSTATAEILNYLAENRILRKTRNKWHWSEQSYPAEEISLRTAAPGNVVILDTSDNGRVIGEIDYFAAPTEVYQNAVYMHQSKQYTIDELDLEDRKAYARPVEVDYYTDAETKVDLKVLDRFMETPINEALRCSGELSVTWLPSKYKKIKFGTHENVGWEKSIFLSKPCTQRLTGSSFRKISESASNWVKRSWAKPSMHWQTLCVRLPRYKCFAISTTSGHRPWYALPSRNAPLYSSTNRILAVSDSVKSSTRITLHSCALRLLCWTVAAANLGVQAALALPWKWGTHGKQGALQLAKLTLPETTE